MASIGRFRADLSGPRKRIGTFHNRQRLDTTPVPNFDDPHGSSSEIVARASNACSTSRQRGFEPRGAWDAPFQREALCRRSQANDAS